MKEVILYGNEAVARELYCFLTQFSDYAVAGFTVDKDCIHQAHLYDLPVIPFESVTESFPPDSYTMFIAVGYVDNNRLRAARYRQAKEMGYSLTSFASSRSTVYYDAVIGDNCFIGHNCCVAPNARIGNNVIIGNGCSIGHDADISDNCFLSNDVSISGSVTIGSNCYLGTNATIRNKIVIGNECVIGAGAVVLESIDDRSVVMGEPARLLPITSDKLPLG